LIQRKIRFGDDVAHVRPLPTPPRKRRAISCRLATRCSLSPQAGEGESIYPPPLAVKGRGARRVVSQPGTC